MINNMELENCLVCYTSEGEKTNNCSNEKCKYYVCESCADIIKKNNNNTFKCLHGCDNNNYMNNGFVLEFNDLPRHIIMHNTLMLSLFFQIMTQALSIISLFVGIYLLMHI